jgi:sugar (pentulose or hexulose) kinase
MNYMIFDIGGSFIKIYDSDTKKIKKIKMFEEPVISLKELKKILLNNLNTSIDYIGISSQMHGFILFDENNNNISEFITWKNYASNNILNENTFDEFKNTGLQKRNDLPINNLNDFLIKNNIFNKKIHFKNITEGILDESFGITHDTMACGHGFYNIFSQNYIHEYIEYFKHTFNIDLVFDNVVNNNQISGFIYYENKKIPVYIGLGDLQASINSFCFKKDFLLLNLATGSQIVSIVNECSNNINPNISYRPFFNRYLKCITHIPSGRFLNIYVDFFNEININFWEYINNLSLDDLYNSNLNIETDIFSKEGISISGIKYNLNLKNLISSILYSYINQYITLIKSNNFTYNFILLSGGIGKKVKLIKLMIEKELHRDVIINESDDDSLFGVIKFINK